MSPRSFYDVHGFTPQKLKASTRSELSFEYKCSTKKSQSVKIEPKCDEIRKYVINFNPTEVFELEPQMQRQVLQGWLEYQRGKVLGLSEDFEQNAYKAQIGIERIQESVKGRH